MRLTLAALLPLALLLSVSRGASAEEPTPAEPVDPGANANPPAAPIEVAPPSSSVDPPAPPPVAPSPVAPSPDALPPAATPEEPKPAAQPAHGDGAVYQNARLLYRDPTGLLELSPSGLLNFDLYSFAGPGVADYQRADGSGLKTNVAARRVRLELVGRVAERWFFVASMESANGAAVLPLNNFAGVDLAPMLKLQVGQFRVPFGMDNTTGIRWGEFMERTLSARVLGAPLTRDLGIMAWGGSDKSRLWYGLAWVGGEGQNRGSTDNRGDVIGRVIYRPFAAGPTSIQQLHFGVSGRYGRRDRNFVQYDAAQMSTPGGYVFWSPVYGSGAGRTHVQPSSDQKALAVEAFIPFERFDLRGELVMVKDGRREVFEATRNNTERSGTLSGYDWYVQASYWVFGPPRLAGAPGTYAAQVDQHAHSRALSLAVRVEALRARYDSTDRSYRDDVLIAGVRRGDLDATSTSIKVNVLQVAATYWATRHARLTTEWSAYQFPTSDNQVAAPGAKANANDSSAKVLHEFSVRLQLSF